MFKAICILLIVLFTASLLLLGSPVQLEEMLEVYSLGEIIIGVVTMSTIMGGAVIAPFILFPRVFEI